MTGEFETEMLNHACRGDAAAVDFTKRALAYFHAADDLVDTEQEPEEKLKTLVRAQELYTHIFFVRNAHGLNAVLRTCESIYADSVAWEKSDDPDQRAWADHARHCGFDLILAVADICGGWEHRRAVSRDVRLYQLACAAQEKQKG